MAENIENKKGFSTCQESPFMAEIIQKISGQEGIGSFCAAMMEKVEGKRMAGDNFPCSRIMPSLMKGCCDRKEKPEESKKEESHD